MSDYIQQYTIIMDTTNNTPVLFSRLRCYTIPDPVSGTDVSRRIEEEVTGEQLREIFDHAAFTMADQVQALNAQIARERAAAQ